MAAEGYFIKRTIFILQAIITIQAMLSFDFLCFFFLK